jgi:molybdopterin-guanine dinucleotide biosynthesis protein A
VSGLPAVAEARPCGGPLAALVEGWDALVRCGWAGPVLVLACDMPLLRPELLALLGTWPTSQSVVPLVRGRPQWLCARYDAGTASGWSAAYAGGTRALRRAVDLSRVAWLGPDEWGSVASAEDFLDADTPRAMTAVSALLRGSDARPAPCATS